MRKQILSLEAALQELVEPKKPEKLNQFVKMYEGKQLVQYKLTLHSAKTK